MDPFEHPGGPAAPAGQELEALVRLLDRRGAVVLSGAGLSTESGIPDYRGATGRRRSGTPMTYQEFTGSVDARRRYWARSHTGWPAIAGARPNAGHHAVERLRRTGHVAAVITQNVDGLHHAAGTREAVELHGGLHRVVCLDCRRTSPRAELDRRLEELNRGFRRPGAELRPDGDARLPRPLVDGFRVAGCPDCGGVLKPDVVFFGENVPAPRVRHCFELVDAASSLVVLGSSLAVLSGLRFVRRAAKARLPVAIVNQGPTRGDELAGLRLDLPLGPALAEVARLLDAA
ncbi:NAD-dependent protein deacetylase [Streptomyces sp. CBMA156]|uniref:NAD-dependent protein deacetylase n=1 Tax=Streptomyces sp. CBMA156 TaxID=1930280 RepID=UPI001661B20F|nr:NAD-dependent protein deacetylase [Streptomyces sp. CBMA156]MBD0676443.1 NAD-dependent deacetylase [Streptomyces sp. CBMA156]